MNFRDVLESAGMFEARLQSGGEFAGVVEAVGAGVDFVSQLEIECLDLGLGCFGTQR